MLKNDRYTYRVTWSEEDKEYIGLCVEYPSLIDKSVKHWIDCVKAIMVQE